MILRPLLALCLAALMALTGQAAAVARGMPGAAGYAELCTGTGPAMVAVDSHGQPVGNAHLCPDNAFLLLQAIALPPALPVPTGEVHRAALPSTTVDAHTPPPEAASARGPPSPT